MRVSCSVEWMGNKDQFCIMIMCRGNEAEVSLLCSGREGKKALGDNPTETAVFSD